MKTATLRNFFLRFPDTEGEQATIRVVFCPIVAAAYMYSLPDHDGIWRIDHRLLYTMVVLYAIAAALILIALLANPTPSAPRRTVALLVDAFTVTASMLVTYEYGIAFFGFYMWICLGYGLRYGARFLRLAQGVTVLGFLVVLAFNPYWQTHLQIGLGLLVTMFYLPPLASLVLERTRKARSDAEEANRSKSRFVANISHEIRTPLNAIVGFSDLFAASRLSSEQQQWMKTISSSATLLLSLVNNVLDLARIEAGKLTLTRSAFQLHELVDGIVSVLGPQAEAKGLYLNVDAYPADVDVVVGDRDHVTQALINLVANAIKFTEQGGVTLRIEKTAETADQIKLTWHVIDTGVGMSFDAAARIFDSFAQADEDTRRRYGGTGLGTTIAKELIECMGGQIGVESVPARGSRFWFSLPFGRVTSKRQASSHVAAQTGQLTLEPPAEIQPIADRSRSGEGRRPRVLVVEDNAANRRVATKILELGGYEVHAADCGLSALINLACESYDLVLLDMELPGLNGLDLLRRLRASPGSDMSIVMLTANATNEARQQCMAEGADGFFTKPIRAPALLRTIESTLERRPASKHSGLPSGFVSVGRLREQLTLGKGLDFVLELIALWREGADSALADLDEAVRQEDRAQVRKQLHLLEGGASEIGAQGFIESCQRLRSLVRDGETDRWAEAMAHIRGTYESTCLLFDALSALASSETELAA
jgi:two-component system sensor histidine kinase RpfC